MRDLRIEKRSAFGGDSNRVDDAFGIRALKTISVGAGRQRREHFFFQVDHRDDDDVRLRQFAAHLLVSAMPSIPGRPMSMTATSGRSRSIDSKPANPSAASPTTSNAASSEVRKPARVSA